MPVKVALDRYLSGISLADFADYNHVAVRGANNSYPDWLVLIHVAVPVLVGLHHLDYSGVAGIVETDEFTV